MRVVFYTSSSADLKDCNCYIITVPTPVNEFKKPEMKFVFAACEMVAKIISHNDVVIFESTVYPGATEEECAPIIAKVSGLTYCKGSPDHISSDKKFFTWDIVLSGSIRGIACINCLIS